MACFNRLPQEIAIRSAAFEVGKKLELAAQEVAAMKGGDREKPGFAFVIAEFLESTDPIPILHHGFWGWLGSIAPSATHDV